MRVYLDKRSVGKDGRCPLRLVIWKDGKKAMPLTGIRVAPGEWDGSRSTNPRLNVRIRDIIDNAEDVELVIKREGRYPSMDLDEFCSEICRKALMTEPSSRRRRDLLVDRMEAYALRQSRAGTREVYQRTVKVLRRFDPDADRRSFRDVDVDYLSRLERWCLENGMRVNSVSLLLRNIRTVFNDARRDGVTVCYPFDRFRIRQEETRKRSLSVGDLRRLAAMDLPEDQRRYRDYFFLMFFLIGINPTDLFNARPGDLEDGRLNYRRDKTGKLFSVKVEPEALAIIERHRGKEFLLEPMDGHGDFLSWRTQLNKRLKALGQVTGKRGKVVGDGPFPFLSTYWARHSWATTAYLAGVPVDIIAQALGHSDRSHRVTFIYIRQDEAKVDEANRRVIDYVSGAL